MATHERELTEPVDLCAPDGKRLNPAARGWSRRPLHRANLRGVWGRTKRWDYWAILAGDRVVTITYADVDYLGIAAVEWFDLASGRKGGREIIAPLARGIALPDAPGTEPLRYRSEALDLDLVDGDAGTSLRARWTERDGATGTLDAFVALPPAHESLNVVIPWSERRFQFTSKHQARPVTGSFARGHEKIRFDATPGGAFGVLDVGRGRWPYKTRWNWGGGAGRAVGGSIVGLQLGGKWTVGTGATENGVVIDGVLHKISVPLTWDYDLDRPLEPWRVHGGGLDATLVPFYDKRGSTDFGILTSRGDQCFGLWSGSFAPAEGERIEFDGIVGWAEAIHNRW